MSQRSGSTTAKRPRAKIGSSASAGTNTPRAPHMRRWATTAGEIPVTVRIPLTAFDQLTALAVLDSTALADQLRAAFENYLATRIADPSLPAQIAEARERQETVLSALESEQAAQAAQAVRAESESRRDRALGPSKPVTVRIDEVTMSRLTALALVDDTTLASQIHDATERYLEVRTGDEDLAERIEEARARQNDALSVLSQ